MQRCYIINFNTLSHVWSPVTTIAVVATSLIWLLNTPLPPMTTTPLPTKTTAPRSPPAAAAAWAASRCRSLMSEDEERSSVSPVTLHCMSITPSCEFCECLVMYIPQVSLGWGADLQLPFSPGKYWQNQASLKPTERVIDIQCSINFINQKDWENAQHCAFSLKFIGIHCRVQ